MAVSTTTEKFTDIPADAIVIGIHADSAPSGPADEFNRASGGLLARLVEAKEVTGKKLETATLLAPPGIKARLALVVGLGPKESFDRGIGFTLVTTALGTSLFHYLSYDATFSHVYSFFLFAIFSEDIEDLVELAGHDAAGSGHAEQSGRRPSVRRYRESDGRMDQPEQRAG